MLKLKSEKYLMENWWGERPFDLEPNEKMRIPVFNFSNATYSGKHIEVPQGIFNTQLRRDLIYRLYNFRINLDKFRSKVTRNRTMTVGSNRKMRPQKGSGQARMSDKRAPHLHKGGKAHGQKAKVYSYPLNTKVKISALKSLLSSKMVEGKIRIVDSESIDEPKTKILARTMKEHIADERAVFCIMTSSNNDRDF